MEDITPPMPAKRALAALDQSAPADIGPPKRISKKVRAAIDAMVSGDCKKISEAAAKVGLARESLSRALSTPHVAEHLRQKVLRHLAIHAARAGATKGSTSASGTLFQPCNPQLTGASACRQRNPVLMGHPELLWGQ
jgi:hypothetical protein